jgi:hypothetical protein
MPVQSVLIPRKKFNLTQAQDYVVEHNYKVKKVDLTENYYRFRQYTPKDEEYITKSLPNGVKLIIARK